MKLGSATLKGVRAWQTVYRVVSVLSGTACVVTVWSSVTDMVTPGHVVLYEDASIALVMAIGRIVSAIAPLTLSACRS